MRMVEKTRRSKNILYNNNELPYTRSIYLRYLSSESFPLNQVSIMNQISLLQLDILDNEPDDGTETLYLTLS